MKSKLPLNRLLALALLGFSGPVVFAAQDAAAPEAAPAEDHSAEFKTLDNDFARMDSLFEQYTDPVHKLTYLGYINLMKTRAEALGWKRPEIPGVPTGGGGRGGQAGGGGGYETTMEDAKPEWDQVKYDELRYDINLQCQRIANWLAPLRTPPPAVQSERGAELSIAKLSPNPANQADVKAALEVLDREIKRMEDRTSTMVIGSAGRDAEVAKVTRIKERRAALGKEFTKARWDALIGDLK